MGPSILTPTDLLHTREMHEGRPRFRTRASVGIAGALIAAVLSGCTSGSPSPEGAEPTPVPTVRPVEASTAGLPEYLATLFANQSGILTSGPDIFEVWICSVPTDTTSVAFEPGGIRLPLSEEAIVPVLTETVAPFFEELSSGAYLPQFVAGGTITLTQKEGPQECLAQSINSSTQGTAVLAIATAEQRADGAGGYGTSGSACAPARPWPCPAAETGRGIYVGASDFHPDWGAIPAVDLIEHEIGHTLGWPHSGLRETGYASALDLMSNSAAPRTTDPAARNAQGTLAINRLLAGWIPLSDAAIVADEPTIVELHPSQEATGVRLAVLPIDADRLLTVEYLTSSGLQSHLPESGVTITLIDRTTSSCQTTRVDRDCRTQQTLVDDYPFDDLLSAAGESWEGWGWSLTILENVGGTARVEIAP